MVCASIKPATNTGAGQRQHVEAKEKSSMAAPRDRPRLLAHLFAAPLVRDTSLFTSSHNQNGGDPGFAPVKQRDYKKEREVIRSTLKDAGRGINFCSAAASAHNFLVNLTGCRALHFTWNGDGNQEQVVFEEEQGLAAPLTEEQFQTVCKKAALPEVVVLSAASAKVVAGAFIRAGISNVVAAQTSDDDHGVMLEFMHTFYAYLAQGRTLRESFDAGVRRAGGVGSIVVSLQTHIGSSRVYVASIPDVLNCRENGDHSISPFDDAEDSAFTDDTPELPEISFKNEPANFLGRQAEVQEVFTHMMKRIKVITIIGFPGIGKTEVALQACSYATERRLFRKIFFVSLQDPSGAPITAMREVEKRLIAAFGIPHQELAEHHDGLVDCIRTQCGYRDDCLLVLDGCPPWFVGREGNRIKLSWVVEQLCERVSNLRYIVTVVKQVGIAREKVVSIRKLSGLAAAELFVASAPREVTVPELRGGMVISGSQVQDAESMRLFSGSEIMTELGGRPGAIIAASNMLGVSPSKGRHLLRHEHEYLDDIIPAQLYRYNKLNADFMRQLEESPSEQNGGRATFKIQREWGWRRGRERPDAGERLWNSAAERQAGAGAALNTLPWKALCSSLADHFLEVMEDDGEYRPLQDEEFDTLGANEQVWSPWSPPASRPSQVVGRTEFLGQFWPWFESATQLLKHTGYWGNRSYPVICSFTTITSHDGEALLRGRPRGTFLMRLSTSQMGALVIMFVDRQQQVVSVPMKVDSAGMFQAEVMMKTGSTTMRSTLGPLILCIESLTHLFPDTPKDVALA